MFLLLWPKDEGAVAVRCCCCCCLSRNGDVRLNARLSCSRVRALVKPTPLDSAAYAAVTAAAAATAAAASLPPGRGAGAGELLLRDAEALKGE
jgi:hypothetical protein